MIMNLLFINKNFRSVIINLNFDLLFLLKLMLKKVQNFQIIYLLILTFVLHYYVLNKSLNIFLSYY